MLEDWFEKNSRYIGESIGFILLSFVSFRALQFAVRWYLFGKCTFRTFSYFKFVQRRRKHSRRVPDSQSLQVVPPNKKWRISNEVVSLIHSVISGVWALYACAMYPKLISEMNTYVHKNALALIYLSFGYILHDLIDLLINERSYRILELLFHHVIVIYGFLTTLTTTLFLGVVMFALLMELNSIFLHTRSLMNLYGQPKNSTAFKFVALLNISTFVIFRMAVSVYLIFWQLTNAFTMRWYLVIITFLIITSLTVTNSVLLYRVLSADGLLGKKRTRQASAITNRDAAITSQTDNEEVLDDKAEENDDESSDFDDYDGTDVEGGNIDAGPSYIERIRHAKNRRDSATQCDSISAVGTQTTENFAMEQSNTSNLIVAAESDPQVSIVRVNGATNENADKDVGALVNFSNELANGAGNTKLNT